MPIPTASAKRLGKRVIGYPEEVVPVISSKDWFNQFGGNPANSVRSFRTGRLPPRV